MAKRFQPFRPVGRTLSTPPGREERIRGRPLQRLRKQIMKEQPLCPDCEAEGRAVAWYEGGELDHIVPLSKGGTNERSNLVGLCKVHHDQKSERERGNASD